MGSDNQFPWQQQDIILQSQRILSSFQHWTGKPLLNIQGTPEELAEALFIAPFFIASHSMQEDPIYNYGNRIALGLWQLDWDNFTKLPSRYSAETMEQEERQRLLITTQAQGICDWRGIRISSTGQRFIIEDGLIWNLLDEQHNMCGQAASFSQWKLIN
ncbi:MAG: MEKHLA domain-containing protein [Aphanothece sp. CMT-3BRIN-NPC111]|jgi:hypothetical protein|nr:MEKHLA domain-containing protein [Aphanothece sp. CMT-3BRIN-NPC111]